MTRDNVSRRDAGHTAIVEERGGWVVAWCVESGAFMAVDQPRTLGEIRAKYLETVATLGLSTVCEGVAHWIEAP